MHQFSVWQSTANKKHAVIQKVPQRVSMPTVTSLGIHWFQPSVSAKYFNFKCRGRTKFFFSFRYAETTLYTWIVQSVQLKSGPILIWVIYLLKFTKCYITQLTCIYSKCWKWCPFISMYLSTLFTMFLATFRSALLFFNNFLNSPFYWCLPSKFFKETLSTVGVRNRF